MEELMDVVTPIFLDLIINLTYNVKKDLIFYNGPVNDYIINLQKSKYYREIIYENQEFLKLEFEKEFKFDEKNKKIILKTLLKNTEFDTIYYIFDDLILLKINYLTDIKNNILIYKLDNIPNNDYKSNL
jgi:hypothetical protein